MLQWVRLGDIEVPLLRALPYFPLQFSMVRLISVKLPSLQARTGCRLSFLLRASTGSIPFSYIRLKTQTLSRAIVLVEFT